MSNGQNTGDISSEQANWYRFGRSFGGCASRILILGQERAILEMRGPSSSRESLSGHFHSPPFRVPVSNMHRVFEVARTGLRALWTRCEAMPCCALSKLRASMVVP